jgi:hypothetical protein
MNKETKEFYRLKMREVRCLVKDVELVKHTITKDSIYRRISEILNAYFRGKLVHKTRCADPLSWYRTKENRMKYHVTPNLKGI